MDANRFVNGTDLFAEYWEEPLRDGSYILYAWGIAPDVAKDLDWVDDEAWRKIAETAGISKEDILREARSKNILERAGVYREVGSYFGFENLDAYPIRLSRKEMEKRWPEFA